MGPGVPGCHQTRDFHSQKQMARPGAGQLFTIVSTNGFASRNCELGSAGRPPNVETEVVVGVRALKPFEALSCDVVRMPTTYGSTPILIRLFSLSAPVPSPSTT